MSLKTFEKLLHKSQNLIQNTGKNEVPSLELDLNQLVDESNLLYSKFSQQQSLDPTAQYFLAQGGVNVREIDDNLRKIESVTLFKPSEIIKSTDIESYLRQKHEKITKDIIKEAREKLTKEVKEYLSNASDKKTQQKATTLNHQTKITVPEDKIVSYATVIRDLNQSRMLSEPFPLIEKLRQLKRHTDLAKAQGRCVDDAWDILCYFTANNFQGVFNKAIHPKPSEIHGMTQHLVQAAKSWLEQRYLQDIDDVLIKYATQVKVGGIPSQSRRLLAYIQFMYKNASNNWTEPNLELQSDMPIWLYLYLLMRIGREDIALEFVENKQDLFYLSPNFPSYLKEYLSTPSRLLSDDNQKTILSEYQQMEYGIEKYDPYKKLLYKIIGRCEMDKPIQMKTKEDYLWLHLSFIRERPFRELYTHEQYRLRDLQESLNTKGPSYFDPERLNPWSYFTILLLSLQFERAVGFLYEYEAFRFEAVHFAIVFAYYGFLQYSRKQNPSVDDIVYISLDGSATIDFEKLIRKFLGTYVADELTPIIDQYMKLLTIYPTL
ncbi:unnamed protein product [Rhizopus microsporus]|uniref:Nuclear pore protein n=2 Tax=Rhizopus TaxID=4842 RepID=A0A1X0S3R0_RHIZD|nr:hypothetical protein G6F71_003682 [Rhizopus microsporus]KAG1212805.1 hypothetical protein G6F69_003368 [Rhizopus microsporus]ORE18819.1 NIC-domain-containing protein [Rhizopus microsporus]